MKRIYLSGPMSDLPDNNYPAFNAAAAAMRTEGFHVENPAENPHHETWAAYMRVALTQMLTCDEVWLLDGWEQSSGAVWEASIAKGLGMPVKVAVQDDEGVGDFPLFSYEQRHIIPLPAPGELRRAKP